jgi:hypothetical protein
MDKLHAQVARILCTFSDGLFQGELPIPTVVVKTNNKFIARFLPDSFCLILGSMLPNATTRQILDSFLHQCCHIYNNVNHIVDHSSHSQYHNRNFADIALKAGLNLIQNENGWGSTSEIGEHIVEFAPTPAQGIREVIYQKILANDPNLQQQVIIKKGKTFQFKYQCRCAPPFNSIRSGRKPTGHNPLRVRCEVCGHLFFCVDEEES